MSFAEGCQLCTHEAVRQACYEDDTDIPLLQQSSTLDNACLKLLWLQSGRASKPDCRLRGAEI